MIVCEWEITKEDVTGFTPENAGLPYVDPDVGAMVLKSGSGIGMLETEEDLIRRGAVYTWQDAFDEAHRRVTA